MRSYPAKKQTLRMADGGNMITRWAANVMKPAQNRLRAVDAAAGLSPAPTFAAAPAPVAQTAAPITAENPAGIRFADGGLRGGAYTKGSTDGGRVVGPGTGISDSVPARYSNGEYVLPADTAAAIGHENLDAIKDATHTPAAEQQAYSLRSQGGQDGQGQNGIRRGSEGRHEGRSASLGGVDNQDRVSLRGSVHPPQQVALADGGIPGLSVKEFPAYPTPTASGMSVSEGPMTGNQRALFNTPDAQPATRVKAAGNFVNIDASQAHGARVNPVPLPDGRYGLPANPELPTPSAASPTSAVKPTLRGGMAAESSGLGKAMYAGGRALAPVAKAIGALGPAATGADVISHFNDYKIDDPSVDSSASGTLKSLRDGDFAGAGRSLSKGVLETGMDLGSAAANTLDYVVPGKAPVSTAYNKMLRGQFGDQLTPHSSVTAQADAAVQPIRAPATPSSVAAPGATANDTQPTMRSDFPDAPTLRGQYGKAVDGAPGVSKFTQGGKTLYSNVPGGDNDTLMSGKPGVSTVPGMSQAAIDQTLTNPDGSRWSAGDNATMAANLRDGVDAYRGTSRDAGKGGGDLMARIAQQGPNHAVASLLTSQQNQATLRGQDLNYSAAVLGQQSTARTAAAAARLDQMNKDRSYQFDVTKFGEEQAKTNFEQRQKSEKDLHDEIGGMLPPGMDGKPDMDRASRYATGLNASLAAYQDSLAKKAATGDKKAADDLAESKKRGVAGLDAADKRAFINSMKVKDLAEQYHSGRANPFGGTAVATDAPRTGLRKSSEGFLGFGGEYTTAQGDKIPARAIERENGEFFGGKRRVDLRQ
jgi:hypothetical protein